MYPKILIATGTRADWGLLLPLARELQSRGVETVVGATNMHLDPALGHTVDEIRADGFEPVKIPASGDPPTVTAMATHGFADLFNRERPDCTVILGDRFEMLGAATAALLSGVGIVHIAGGTVSEGAFDDSIRHAITKMATLHLVETDRCRDRVVRMGEDPDRVITAGAPGVYNVMRVPLLSKEELGRSLSFSFPGHTLLVTLHAATLDPVPPSTRMRDLIQVLEEFMDNDPEAGVLFTYPNNDTDPRPQVELIEEFASRHPERVVTSPSLGRVRYLSALKVCKAVIGNSSSGLVEVPSAGIPTLDIGVRQMGREAGPSVLHCGASVNEIRTGLAEILGEHMQGIAAGKINPYYRPDTPAIMADAIMNYHWKPFPQKRFYDGEKQ